MSNYVEVFDEDEVTAVRNGEIEGDVYRDGECWADPQSLIQWREKNPLEERKYV